MKAVVVGVQEFQAELQRRELEIAALKTKVDDILKGHTEDSPGYKELKKQKRRLGTQVWFSFFYCISIVFS